MTSMRRVELPRLQGHTLLPSLRPLRHAASKLSQQSTRLLIPPLHRFSEPLVRHPRLRDKLPTRRTRICHTILIRPTDPTSLACSTISLVGTIRLKRQALWTILCTRTATRHYASTRVMLSRTYIIRPSAACQQHLLTRLKTPRMGLTTLVMMVAAARPTKTPTRSPSTCVFHK